MNGIARIACILLGMGLLFIPCVTKAAEIVTIAGTGEAGFAGDGEPALKAKLHDPFGLEIGPDGMLYFCDFSNHVLRKIDLNGGLIFTVAGVPGKTGLSGDGGPAFSATFHEQHQLRFDRQVNIFVSDTKSNVIRRIDGASRVITTVAGTGEAGFSGDGGPATKAKLNLPIAVLVDAKSTYALLVCDIKNHRVRQVDLTTGTISTFAGNGDGKPTTDGGGLLESAIYGPRSLAIESNGDLILVLREGNAAYRINRKNKTLQHLAGTGKKGFTGDGADAKLATLNGPKGLAVDKNGNILLCDTENHVIRVIDKATGKIDTLVGDGTAGDGPDGDPRKCRLHRPHGIFVANDGTIYIGDSSNNKVRKLVR